MKSSLKKKKAQDQQGWRNEYIIEAGKDLEKSIKAMLNEILKTNLIPEEWNSIKIKSIFKNKGSKNDITNRRGLFITNVLSKSLEKIIIQRNQEVILENISPYQCGGLKNRGITDHLFTLNAAIDFHIYNKKELYLLFADTEKCFDKLWLQDCIIDLIELNFPPAEANLIYSMNKQAKAIIETPFGKTEPITLNEIVRQGTVAGTMLCGVSTDKVNVIGKTVKTNIGTNVQIESLIFVDDILGIGNKQTISNLGNNLSQMEITKKFTFNVKKTQYVIINEKNKKEESQKLNIELKSGNIIQTNSYKYLGDWYNEKADNTFKIKKRVEKIKYLAKEVRRYGNYQNVGRADVDIRFLLIDTIAHPSILYNTEAWSMIKEKDNDILHQAQAEFLKIIFEQKTSTPFWGIIAETRIWPWKFTIIKKKLMFLHQLINATDDRRIAKKILLDQIQSQQYHGWYYTLQNEIKEYNINISIDNMMKTTKSKWKNEIESKLVLNIKKIDKIKNKTKMRYIKEFKKQDYLKQYNGKTCQIIMQIRLNMVETRENYKSKYQQSNTLCQACKLTEETTEHIFKCQKLRELSSHQLNSNNFDENIQNTEWLKEASTVIIKIQEIKECLKLF